MIIPLTAFTLLITGIAFAHRVTVFAWVEGDTVHVESKFSGSKKVKGGTIVVTDSSGAELLTGKTNDQGEFSFKLPRRTTLKITLKAGMGHQAEWTIPVEDFESATHSGKAPAQETMPNKVHPSPEAALHNPQPSESRRTHDGLNSAEIETIVENALDKKLKPVLKILAESRDKGPTIGEVIGGIGYIVGLMGLAAYFRYRKRDI